MASEPATAAAAVAPLIASRVRTSIIFRLNDAELAGDAGDVGRFELCVSRNGPLIAAAFDRARWSV
jgi:hypothetical protein